MLTEVETICPACEADEDAIVILKSIPTVFGRLVYLAAMWDAPTWRYRCDLQDNKTCSREMSAALGRAHLAAFCRWLTLSLERQHEDLMYFANSDGPKAYECLRSWLAEGFFDQLAPITANRHETKLFRDNLVFVIQSLGGDSRA